MKPNRKWIWGIAIAAAVALLMAFGFPGIIAVYQLYWSPSNIQRLFYEDLGLNQAWSSFIAVVGSFFYALAWVPLTLWTFRVLVWRFSARQVTLAFACWVFVYGHVPLLHALLGTDACFNQRTGAPMKWFVEGPNGEIMLFDSGGFDTIRGVEKRPVTSEICGAFARQKVNGRPQRITANIREIEFFDPNSGRSRVWYSKAADGGYDLFDTRGFHPVTSEPLLPVTREVVAEIMAHATTEAEEARKRAEATEAQRRIEAEEVRKRIDAEADRRRVATISPECPGTGETKVLGTEWILINPGFRCSVIFNTTQGEALLGEPNNYVEDRPGIQLGNIMRERGVRVIYAKAKSGSARVNYMLCPHGKTRPDKWRCAEE